MTAWSVCFSTFQLVKCLDVVVTRLVQTFPTNINGLKSIAYNVFSHRVYIVNNVNHNVFSHRYNVLSSMLF